MLIQSGLISGADHVGLPSLQQDWPVIRAFWGSLGLDCRTYFVENPDYDHAGAGSRLQVFSGTKLVISYYVVGAATPPGLLAVLIAKILLALTRWRLKALMEKMHVGLTTAPQALDAARAHRAFDRETHWGHGNTSVFLIGPYGLHVELVTTNPEYHRDHA